MIRYVLKNLKLSKGLYFPLFFFSFIMSALISFAVFMYNSTKANAIEYSKIMGDLDIGIFYQNEKRDDFYQAVLNLDKEKAGIEKIVAVPMVIGDLAIGGVVSKQNAAPLSYLESVSSVPLDTKLSIGEVLISSNEKNVNIGEKAIFIYPNENGEISSTEYTIKGNFYVNDILQNTIILRDEDFNRIYGDSSPYYFSVYVNHDNKSLLSFNDFSLIYSNITEQLKEFENEYFISFFSQSIYKEISRFILLIEIAVAVVILVILLLEFSLSITIFISLLEVRKTDLGMFLAFGMSKKKISVMFSLESLIISFIGTVVGIAFSILLAYLARFINLDVTNYIMKIVNDQLVYLPKYFDWKNIAIPLLCSSILPTLIYFIYERKQIKKNISNLINDRG